MLFKFVIKESYQGLEKWEEAGRRDETGKNEQETPYCIICP